jgi:uncharacterized protein YbjT (DUF2867 family)
MYNTYKADHRAKKSREGDPHMTKRALVLGATGLVGKELVKQLVEDPDYAGVTAIVRKPLSFSHPKLKEVLANFDKLELQAAEFHVDAVYCCLGTTIKVAGSKEAFKRVDLDYPVHAAQLARSAGVRHFAVISSTGADEGSMFFYTRVKGELERILQETGLPSLHIFRPSLLLGDRNEKRAGEGAAAAISCALPFIWSGPLRKYKPVEASTVAAAMRAAVRQDKPGVCIYQSSQLFGLTAV